MSATLRACRGRSAHGACPAPVRYQVGGWHVCGRHVAWILGRLLLTEGDSTPVVRISPLRPTKAAS